MLPEHQISSACKITPFGRVAVRRRCLVAQRLTRARRTRRHSRPATTYSARLSTTRLLVSRKTPNQTGVRHFGIPKRNAIIGIHGEYDLVAGYKQPPVLVQRRHVADMAIDHASRPGLAEPL